MRIRKIGQKPLYATAGGTVEINEFGDPVWRLLLPWQHRGRTGGFAHVPGTLVPLTSAARHCPYRVRVTD